MKFHPATAWRRFTWDHPEWWSLGFSLLAWVVILEGFQTGAGSNPHQHHHAAATSLTGDMLHWMLMVVAMMLPLVADSVRNTAAMSLWSRRHRAIAGFLLGYLSVWLMVGAVISLVVFTLTARRYFNPATALAISFCAALLWQGVSYKKRALRACHRTMPLAPNGLRADVDCLRYGWMIGGSCLLSCWAMMALCAVSGHSLGIMLFVTFVGLAERYPLRQFKGMTLARS